MKFINEAPWDRIVRVILGLGLLYLAWAGVVTGGWGMVLVIVGAVALLTGVVGFCPLYAVLKFRTNKV
jgi:hypothetical protein